MLPVAANVLPDDNLRTISFFRWFNNGDLYGTNGSAVAQDWHLRAQVLGDGIPAMSRALGRNNLNGFGQTAGNGAGVDMAGKENGWPQVRLSNPDFLDRWLHSDIKDIAYLFTFHVFDDVRGSPIVGQRIGSAKR